MPSTAYVSYCDVIVEPKVRALMTSCAQFIEQTRATELYMLFSSTGGSVDAGIMLYNFLRALPASVTMHNIANIDSIGNVVFLAAEKRYACSHSSFLFHGLSWSLPPGVQLTRNQLRENIDTFAATERRMSGIITERTKLTEAELDVLYGQGETKDLVFAKDKGIIHEVRPAKVPPNTPFLALNFQ
ncbi:MAG TPA: ATP-dependent Clp protease proteolytic subunit [Candidatus Binatia bacterium]|nr:ATP-dependent Clp protease proteolytic subunit [Candidatus Binatia bacterium]